MPVLIFAAVSAFALCLLLLAAASGRLRFGGAVSAAQSDKALFRGQMAELEKMQGQGLLDAASGKEARLELARRILAAEKQAETQSETKSGAGGARRRGLKAALSAAILAVPLFSFLIYYYQGQPFLPAKPFAELMARDPATLTAEEKITRQEALLARSPRDSGRADDLAAAYLQAGRFQDAANTYAQAIALGGETAPRRLGYALALTGFADGVVDSSAEEAFRSVLRLDPHNHQAQLFLARGLLQNGKPAEAAALLQGFLAKTPQGDPWAAELKAAIAALQSPPKPQNAAPALSAEQRAFIAAHLGGLEARLRAEPQNAQAWAMLVNAHVLLGERKKAEAALQAALAALPAAQAAELKAMAAQKGLAPTAPQTNAPAQTPAP